MLRPFVIAIRIHSSCQVLFDGCEGILTLRVATILQPYHMRAWALFHWGSPKILALWGPPGGLISLVIWGRGAPYRSYTGTERNEMERNETKRNGKERQKGGLWCKTSGPDEARKTAGRQARHRVHFSWTQSNAEGVWTPSNAEAEGPSC